jgi:hypothetical protein
MTDELDAIVRPQVSNDDKIKFRATRKEFTLSDDGGYQFDVTLVHDDEYGWSAHASFAAHGYKTEQAALGGLDQSVSRFLELLKKGADV